MKAAGRRRGFVSWFVEPYRQVKLGLMFLGLNLVFSALIFLVFGYYLWDVYQTMAVYFSFTDQQSLEVMSKFRVPALIGAGLLFVFISLSIMLSVRYTYRIYGPLVSIHRFLDDILAGQKVGQLTLRESDQLKELAEKLNQLADQVEQANSRPAATTRRRDDSAS